MERDANLSWAWSGVVLAWISLVWMAFAYPMHSQQHLASEMMHHHDLTSGIAMVFEGLRYLLHWQVMLAAMMLPSVLPVAHLLSSVIQSNSERTQAQFGFVLGYWAVWTLAAIGFYIAQLLAPFVVARLPWGVHPWTGIFVVGAGLFQFTPMKTRCLQGCRSAAMAIAQYYYPGILGGWQLGWQHGLFCLGCCWALMGLMGIVGLHNLMIMLVLTALMAVERLWRYGEQVAYGVGVLLIAIGLGLMWLQF